MSGAGKGDTPRPIDKTKYDNNYAGIDWGKKDDKSQDSQKKK